MRRATLAASLASGSVGGDMVRAAGTTRAGEGAAIKNRLYSIGVRSLEPQVERPVTDTVTDLADPVMFADPFPRYAELRRQGAVSPAFSKQLMGGAGFMLTR